MFIFQFDLEERPHCEYNSFFYLDMFVHVFTICTCLYLSFDDFSSHLRLNTLFNAANMHQLLFDFMINHNNYNLFKCDWCINCCNLSAKWFYKVLIRQLAVIVYTCKWTVTWANHFKSSPLNPPITTLITITRLSYCQ